MTRVGFRHKLMLALLGIACFVVSGCLGSGGSLTNIPSNEVATVKLKIRLGRIDSRVDTKPEVLTKGSSIKIQNLVVTFTSSLKDTIRDTVTSQNFGGFGTEELLDQSVLVNVSLRALRWWNIDIESHDQYDSVVHKGTAGPFASKGGQTMDLSIPLLNSRYLMYEARYSLPPEIYAAALANDTVNRVKQKIYFHRLVLEIDGIIVDDSTSFSSGIVAGPRFFSADPAKLKGALGKLFFKPYIATDTVTHVQSYEYIKVGTHTFKMSAYGYLEGDSVGGPSRLLYQGQGLTSVTQTGTEDQNVNLKWMGPGSTFSDSLFKADSTNSGNWNGINVTVKFGRVKSGSLDVEINPAVPFKRPAGIKDR